MNAKIGRVETKVDIPAPENGVNVFSSFIGFLLFGILALYLAAAQVVGPYGWDDGAITVAFARSLAEGRFALTMASEIVEGSSSLLYVFLLALVTPTDPDLFPLHVQLSQWLTALCFFGVLIALFAALRPAVPGVIPRVLVLTAFAALPFHLTEIFNGMEMELLALLLLGFAVAERHDARWSFALIPLICLVRFEGAFYVGVTLVGLLMFDTSRRDGRLGRLAFLFLVFGLITLGRYFYFSDVMPNTIWAKMHYSDSGPLIETLRQKAQGPLQFFGLFAPLLLIGAAAAIFAPSRAALRHPAFWLLVAFVLFAFATGRNQGYAGRMFVGALPLLVLLLADVMRPLDRGGLGWTTSLALVLALGAAFVGSRSLVKENVKLVAYAAEHRYGVQVGSLSDGVRGAWPLTYYQSGRSADTVREALGLETLTLLAPDIGGLGLCCDPDRIRVVDLALLANRRLAHDGWGAFPDQMETEIPDLVLTHWLWSQGSRIYEVPAFTENYSPVVIVDTLFHIKRAHADRLEADGKLSPLPSNFTVADLANDFSEIDYRYLATAPAPRRFALAP